MLTYKALIDSATRQLYETSETPRIDCEVLMQHMLNKDMAWLISYGDTVASPEHNKAFFGLIAERLKGTPIAYIVGSRDFWSLELMVNEHVLIPRPDTETLVEQALELLPENESSNVLDLGTGSGAIALSIAKERRHSNVIALEYSKAALEVAKHNSVLNNVTNVEFRHSNWFENIGAQDRFNLIASNPPYVEPNDPHLEQGDLRFEPISALTAEEDGLADIRHIIESAPLYLEHDGWLIIEHGYNQANEVESLFRANGFTEIELFFDLNKLPRCTLGKKRVQQ